MDDNQLVSIAQLVPTTNVVNLIIYEMKVILVVRVIKCH